MSDEIISGADQIRQVLRDATKPLSSKEIFELADSFNDANDVSKQIYAFVQRGEAIRTNDAKGKARYELNPKHAGRAVKHAEKAAVIQKPPTNMQATRTLDAKPTKSTIKAAVVKRPRQEPEPERAPVGSTIQTPPEDCRSAGFAVSDDGALGITNHDGATIRLLPGDILALSRFMDATKAIWQAA